jgi:hypothetical protein
LKLLAEAEEEELLDDDDEVTEPTGRDVDPVVLDPVGLETEPDEDNVDDADPELVVVTVAPMANGALVPITELILLTWTASSVY